jgi:cytochrome bd-type quinol oxidase subunit 2
LVSANKARVVGSLNRTSVIGFASAALQVLERRSRGLVLRGVFLASRSGTGDLTGDRVTTGFFADWLTPFALACGLFALALFAFLAATYMTVDTRSEPDLQNISAFARSGCRLR